MSKKAIHKSIYSGFTPFPPFFHLLYAINHPVTLERNGKSVSKGPLSVW